MPGLTVTTRHSYAVMVTNSGNPTRKACSPGNDNCVRGSSFGTPGEGSRRGRRIRRSFIRGEERAVCRKGEFVTVEESPKVTVVLALQRCKLGRLGSSKPFPERERSKEGRSAQPASTGREGAG